MKQIFCGLLVALFAFMGTGCVRHTIIPDEELALIFHDVFLANAYTSGRNLTRDSLNIYEPIFEQRGYTTEDIQYTIGNFSKRKSARLGDVVEKAIDLLEEEGKNYNHEVAILDTINQVALRKFTHVIHQDSLIKVRSLKDTSRLKFRFDVQPGDYQIMLNYKVDSLDKNQKVGIEALVYMERANKSRSGETRMLLHRNYREHFNRTLTADTTHRHLVVDFIHFRKGNPQRPSIRVENFVVKYVPKTEVAVDSLFLKQANYRVFADEFLNVFDEKNSK